MSFSLASFEPRPSEWFTDNVTYEGPGSADFTSPIGSAIGPFTASFDQRGEQVVRAVCEGISCDPEYDGPTMMFLAGSKVQVQGNQKSWGFGGLDNPCSGLQFETPEGTFSATCVSLIGFNAQIIVARTEDVKPMVLRFHLTEGKFETKNSNAPKFFVLPLLNCVAERGNTLLGSHPLRIYPTPAVPETLSDKEKFMAQLTANKRNAVVAFLLKGRICFIEALPDYEERKSLLENGAQRLITAVLVGELAGEPVNTLSEFRSWFPTEVLSALGFASGVDVGCPWVEVRDEYGALILRLHGKPWLTLYDDGDVSLEAMDAAPNSGIGEFLTRYLECSPEKRAYLEAAMNHARIGSLGSMTRLYDNLDHLIRALECLCRAHGFMQIDLLPKLSSSVQDQVKLLLAKGVGGLQSLIAAAQQAQSLDDARLLATIQSRVANAGGTEQKFGLSVVALLEKFGLGDAAIIDAHFIANPRPDGVRDWASVVTSYRGATIHEGYMDFGKKHDAADVIRICRHLKDVLTRLIFRDIGYGGTYESVLRGSYGPQPLDWVQASTPAKHLRFS